jgi:putative ABC transport system substrate-binding protein
VRRREFITLLAAATVWPLAVRAQQTAMPVIGFLHPASDTLPDRLRGFRQGLKDTGYVEGENVATVYRWAENEIDRLPELVAELARRQVAVLVTIGNATTLAAIAGRAVGEVRAGHQPSDRQDARPYRAADAAGPRRRVIE